MVSIEEERKVRVEANDEDVLLIDAFTVEMLSAIDIDIDEEFAATSCPYTSLML